MAEHPQIENGLWRYLDTDGDGTGTKVANVDGGTPVAFLLTPPSDKVYHVARMIVFVEDTGQLLAGTYGALSALTNGIKVDVIDAGGNVVVDLLDGITIKTNAAWARVCYDSAEHTYGSGNNFLVVRWTFARSGQDLHLDGRKGHSLSVTIQDDLQGLVDHTFKIQGTQEHVLVSG